ncbi:MAG: hypothetical protein M0Z75_05450, partial [Nitrospiraceae bacterium]|nr:hypothetical protein [Nitrospiraceae bacterium]
MTRKVLIIAHSFPPMQVIGSQRPYGLAKYLRGFGWEPVILTVSRRGSPPDGIMVISTDCTDRIAAIKKFAGFDPGEGLHQQ